MRRPIALEKVAAIRALAARGYEVEEVAPQVGVHKEMVRRYLRGSREVPHGPGGRKGPGAQQAAANPMAPAGQAAQDIMPQSGAAAQAGKVAQGAGGAVLIRTRHFGFQVSNWFWTWPPRWDRWSIRIGLVAAPKPEATTLTISLPREKFTKHWHAAVASALAAAETGRV